MRRSSLLTLLAAITALTAMPSPAAAGGFEYPGAGTRPLGRGGAFAARADSHLALLYNPANLAGLSGAELGLDMNLALYDACVNRSGTYTDYDSNPSVANDPNSTSGRIVDDLVDSRYGSSGDFAASGIQTPRVCNSGPVGLGPQLAFGWRIHKMLGIGVGLVAPAAVGHTVWGRTSDGTIRANGVPAADPASGVAGTVDGRLPSPIRYNLIEEDLIIAYPSVGVGFAPIPQFRVGVAFGFGFGLFNFTNVTRPSRGEELGLDIYSQLKATDAFIPRITASVHVVPHDNLDIMASFTWTDDVDASGRVKLTSAIYAEPDPSAGLPDVERISGIQLSAPQPWQAAFGIRYADRISPRPEDPTSVSQLTHRVEDSMATERWDVELDVVYEMNSRVDEFNVAIPAGNTITVAPFLEAPIPDHITLPHGWKDQLSIRLGGDYNIMPGMAALRAGFSFETRGVEDGFTQVDFMPLQRYGLHLGLTARAGNLDFSLAYAHFFQESITVNESNAAVPQVVASEDVAGPPTIINSGRYTASYNVVSIGVDYHFQ